MDSVPSWNVVCTTILLSGKGWHEGATVCQFCPLHSYILSNYAANLYMLCSPGCQRWKLCVIYLFCMVSMVKTYMGSGLIEGGKRTSRLWRIEMGVSRSLSTCAKLVFMNKTLRDEGGGGQLTSQSYSLQRTPASLCWRAGILSD
jgi:hypothetical protein